VSHIVGKIAGTLFAVKHKSSNGEY